MGDRGGVDGAAFEQLGEALRQHLAEPGHYRRPDERVEAILESARAKMRSARQQIGRPSDDTTRATMRAAMEAIRQDTDKQLATVLSADDIGKLNAALHHPPPR